MNRLLIALLATAAVLPACGSQDGTGKETNKGTKAAAQDPKAHGAADPHAGHGAAPGAAADPHSGHQMGGTASTDPHSGHAAAPGAAGTDSHAGHSMAGAGQGVSNPHAGHAMGSGRAAASANPHAGHIMAARGADPHAGHSAAPRPGRQAADPHAGHRPAASPTRIARSDPHAGHAMPAPNASADPHAGHVMPETAPVAADPHAGHAMPATTPADPHAGHSVAPTTPADPHAGHSMPAAAAADPHAGHDMASAGSATATDPHAGHDMGATEVPAPPTAPPPAAALTGPAHAADLVFGAADMAQAREGLRKEHGDIVTSKVLIDQAELKVREGGDGYAWDAQAWHGGDIDKVWIKTEGEGILREEVEKAEVQALWSHAIDPWFDLQLGLRHDFSPDPSRTHLVAGVQGLAPYWFEVDGALFLSNKGELSARMEGEYDLRITQRLILQPRAEVELAFQDVPELGIGAGLFSAEFGARLRYEIRPEFAPYVGVEYERAFGKTADFTRARGEKAGAASFLIGIRTWF